VTGNTATLVETALEEVEHRGIETDIIRLGELTINGCTGCEGCAKTMECTIDDDMQRLYPIVREADALIVGSPTYFYDVTSDMKAFIDRCYALVMFDAGDRSCWVGAGNMRSPQPLLGVVTVCEQHDVSNIRFTADVIELGLESVGYRPIGTIKVPGLFGQGEASRNEGSLNEARRLGARIATTLVLQQQASLLL
jgi:multimeric flavodoxin WrbA